MKKTFFAAAIVLAFAVAVSAHLPSDIIITFDLSKSTVYANIMHDSKEISKHFIKQIVVLVNGKSMITQLAVTQTDSEKQSVSYVIPGLKTGDKVAIDADCSIFGDLTKEAVAGAKVQAQETKKPLAKPEVNASSKFKTK